MTLKEFCLALQQCANKLEEEIKININDVNNLIHSNLLSDTKMALEKAKDDHYKEIIDGIAEILKNIKKLLFHQNKIEWLSNENNFTQDELKRFSYVKRKIHAFSNPEESVLSRNSSIKREKRKTASEVSIGSLEAWEKYLDQKDKEEKQAEEKVIEEKPLVPKRALSNARRRKKFVSSTMGGFLDADERRRGLDSIIEDPSYVEENEPLSYSKSLESLDQMIDNEKKLTFEKSKKISFGGSLDSMYIMTSANELNADKSKDCKKKEGMEYIEEPEKSKSLDNSLENVTRLSTSTQTNKSIINIINETVPKDDESIMNEIMVSFLNDGPVTPEKIANDNLAETRKEMTKPKIVDVIFKKKPS